MTWPDLFLFCFAVGVLWSFASLLLGGLHLGHWGHGHAHAHGGLHSHGKVVAAHGAGHSWQNHVLAIANPSGMAAFLTWFGGMGYLLTRHSGWAFWLNLTLALAVGLTGAWLLGAFLQFLQRHEKVMDPMDDEMAGILGQVTCPIRCDGVGELIYFRDGARNPLVARSEDGNAIERGSEVVVIRYEKGIAYVRTWEAMNREIRQ